MLSEKLQVSSWSLTGVNKVRAVKLLLNYLNVELKDTFAFGDAASDINMVKYCNIGVTKDNAADELKEAADYVTNHVNEDGLWNAFKEYEVI